VVSCPTQYYYDSASNSCLKACVAGTNCQTCANQSTCSSCTGYGYLYQKKCVTNCPGNSALINGVCVDHLENPNFGSFGGKIKKFI
jgi:proprotein convertase subtilisin/kexin type 5